MALFFFIKKGKFPVFVKMFSEAMSRFDSSYVRGRNMAALFLNPSSAPPCSSVTLRRPNGTKNLSVGLSGVSAAVETQLESNSTRFPGHSLS